MLWASGAYFALMYAHAARDMSVIDGWMIIMGQSPPGDGLAGTFLSRARSAASQTQELAGSLSGVGSTQCSVGPAFWAAPLFPAFLNTLFLPPVKIPLH